MPFPVEEKWIKEAESKLDVKFPDSYRHEISIDNGGYLTVNDETWDLYPIWDKSDRKRLKRTCNDIVHETEVCNDCIGFPSKAVAIASNAWIMPRTVPSRPSNGQTVAMPLIRRK